MRPRRLDSFDYIGRSRYFVTACTHRRKQVFDERTVGVVQPAMAQAFRARHFSVLAWTFMPDHTHWVIEGNNEASNYRAAMALARQRSGFAFQQAFGTRLWQDGTYEHVIRQGQTLESVVAYLLNNPVRARLVADWREYPHPWAAEMCFDGRGLR